MGGAGFGSANAATAEQVRKNTRYEELFTAKAKTLVKGVGHVTNGGVPLQDGSHGTEIMTRSRDAILTTKAATAMSTMDAPSRDAVIEGIRPEFWDHPRAGGMKFMAKNFTATNLGATGAPYGLVPFDLLAPSRLIYPVYTLFRNKFPRPAGQGASKPVYGVLGISGSQTGGQGVVDISPPELA